MSRAKKYQPADGPLGDGIPQSAEPLPKVVEGKNAKFRRLAQRRVGKATAILAAIGNLSNRSSYSYTTEEVDAIHTALAASVDQAMTRFGGPSKTVDLFSGLTDKLV